MRSRHPAIVTTRSSMAALNRFVEAGAILIFILVARRSSAVTHTVSLFFKKMENPLQSSPRELKKEEEKNREERERERERERAGDGAGRALKRKEREKKKKNRRRERRRREEKK